MSIKLDKNDTTKETRNSVYEKCKDCGYYYGEIDNCMFGEDGVPTNLEKKCEVEKDD